jgi:hypothetical protein
MSIGGFVGRVNNWGCDLGAALFGLKLYVLRAHSCKVRSIGVPLVKRLSLHRVLKKGLGNFTSRRRRFDGVLDDSSCF